MIKAVCMFKLPKGTNEEKFDDYFMNKHVIDAKKLKFLKKYTVAKVINENNNGDYYFRINELYYDSLEEANQSFSSETAKLATEDLLGRVIDFTCIFCEEENIKL